ncbi:MAG: methyltransferase [Alphaproteobacteria bacterium]|nr:methyltransferase [Alphaproteobacteria bacterium]
MADQGGAVTRNTLLGGRVKLTQPAQGFRAAIDPVLLAAAVPAGTGESALDAGSGTGAAALCLAVRVPGARVTGLEIDADLVRLAEGNAADTGVAGRVRFVAGDVCAPDALAGVLAGATFDHVLTNPPFAEPGSGTASPDRARRRATVEGAGGLGRWLDGCLDRLKAGGRLTLIHRADRLDDVLDCLKGRAGGGAVLPLLPGPGKPPKRVIVFAVNGSSAPMKTRKGLVLHGPDGKYTDGAEAILRHGQALDL